MKPGPLARSDRNLTALVLEDSVLLLLDLQEALLGLGVGTVLKASSIYRALSVLESSQPDFAIVDYDIDGTASLMFVDELIRRAVPLLLVTGYGPDINLPAQYRGLPLLAMPFSMSELEAKINGLFEC